MTPVQILGMPQSPLVWAVRMAAEEKGIPAEMIMLMPHTPEITAIQPFGKIPAFKHGAVELAESRAIARYLDGLSHANPLMPGDHVAAAKAEQWIMHFYTEYAPVLLARYIGPYFFPSGPNGAPDRAVIDAAIPLVEKALAALETQLEGKVLRFLKEILPRLSSSIFFLPLLSVFVCNTKWCSCRTRLTTNGHKVE